MGKMKEIHMLLNDFVDEGIDCGYMGDQLSEYVYDQAVNCFRLPPSMVTSFIVNKIVEAEKQVFDE